MNFRQLNSFVRCAEHKSFSAAAQTLYISVNSLIQQIDLLEQEVGFSLFHRTTRGIHLTDSGLLFYNGTKSILADMDTLLQQCRPQTVTEFVRIGFPKGGRFLFIDAIYEKCQELYPNIQISFLPELPSLLDSLCKNQVDLVLLPALHAILTNKNLHFTPLFDVTPFCVFSSQHPLASKKHLFPSDLSKYNILLDDMDWLELFPFLKAKSQQIEIVTSSSTVYSKCNTGSIYLISESYAKLYSPFRAVPLEQAGTFSIGIVSSSSPSDATKKVAQIARDVISLAIH